MSKGKIPEDIDRPETRLFVSPEYINVMKRRLSVLREEIARLLVNGTKSMLGANHDKLEVIDLYVQAMHQDLCTIEMHMQHVEYLLAIISLECTRLAIVKNESCIRKEYISLIEKATTEATDEYLAKEREVEYLKSQMPFHSCSGDILTLTDDSSLLVCDNNTLDVFCRLRIGASVKTGGLANDDMDKILQKYTNDGNINMAIFYLRNHLDTQGLQDGMEKAAIMKRLGYLYEETNEGELAIECYTTAVRMIYEATCEPNEECAYLLHRIAFLHVDKWSYDSAVNAAKEALQILGEFGDKELLAMMYKSITGIYVKAGRLLEAEDAITKAMSYLSTSDGDTTIEETLGCNYMRALLYKCMSRFNEGYEVICTSVKDIHNILYNKEIQTAKVNDIVTVAEYVGVASNEKLVADITEVTSREYLFLHPKPITEFIEAFLLLLCKYLVERQNTNGKLVVELWMKKCNAIYASKSAELCENWNRSDPCFVENNCTSRYTPQPQHPQFSDVSESAMNSTAHSS